MVLLFGKPFFGTPADLEYAVGLDAGSIESIEISSDNRTKITVSDKVDAMKVDSIHWLMLNIPLRFRQKPQPTWTDVNVILEDTANEVVRLQTLGSTLKTTPKEIIK